MGDSNQKRRTYFTQIMPLTMSVFCMCIFGSYMAGWTVPTRNIVPRPYMKVANKGTHDHKPTIAYASTYFGHRTWPESEFRNFSRCRNKCLISDDPRNADALVFHHRGSNMYAVLERFHRNANRSRQVFIFFGRESEIHAKINAEHLKSVFNWTATYKLDSDVIIGYGHIEPLKKENKGHLAAEFDKDTSHIESNNVEDRTKVVTGRNFAKGKNKMAVMMVNNCGANSNRLEYAKKLPQYGVSVDIFGNCGKRCPGGWCKLADIAKQYKFYLAFENSHCPDYITEKFWRNALHHGMVPVTLGSTKEDYLKVAPPHSFIHTADFKTVAALAEYLKLLDKNDMLYNEYFEWKKHNRVAETIAACRLCEALHDEKRMNRKKVHLNLSSYWDATSHCQKKGPLPLQ